MKPYKLGVEDATTPMTYEEAVTCGFREPDYIVNHPGVVGKLLDLRRKRLLDDLGSHDFYDPTDNGNQGG